MELATACQCEGLVVSRIEIFITKIVVVTSRVVGGLNSCHKGIKAEVRSDDIRSGVFLTLPCLSCPATELVTGLNRRISNTEGRNRGIFLHGLRTEDRRAISSIISKGIVGFPYEGSNVVYRLLIESDGDRDNRRIGLGGIGDCADGTIGGHGGHGVVSTRHLGALADLNSSSLTAIGSLCEDIESGISRAVDIQRLEHWTVAQVDHAVEGEVGHVSVLVQSIVVELHLHIVLQRVGDSDGIGLTLGIRDSLVEEHSPFCRAGLTCSDGPATLTTRSSLVEDDLREILDRRDHSIRLIDLHFARKFGALHVASNRRIRELRVCTIGGDTDATEGEREILLTVKGRHRLCRRRFIVTLAVDRGPVSEICRIELFLLALVFLRDSDTTEIGTASADDLDITGLSFCSRCSVGRRHLCGSDATDSVVGVGSTVAGHRHLVLGVLDRYLDDGATVELCVTIGAGLQLTVSSVNCERDTINIGGYCTRRALN